MQSSVATSKTPYASWLVCPPPMSVATPYLHARPRTPRHIRPFATRARQAATHLCAERVSAWPHQSRDRQLTCLGGERCAAANNAQTWRNSRQCAKARTRAHLSLALRAGNARCSPGDAGSVIDGALGCIVNGPGEDEWPSTSMRLVICRPSVGGAISPMPAIATRQRSGRGGGCELARKGRTRGFFTRQFCAAFNAPSFF